MGTAVVLAGGVVDRMRLGLAVAVATVITSIDEAGSPVSSDCGSCVQGRQINTRLMIKKSSAALLLDPNHWGQMEEIGTGVVADNGRGAAWEPSVKASRF